MKEQDLRTPSEIFDDLLADEQSVIVIEWAERMGAYPLPNNVWRIDISGDGEDARQIAVARLR